MGHHIGNYVHPEVRCDRHTLAAGEYITAVGGRLGDICDQLNFTTSTDRVIKGGGEGGQPQTANTEGASRPYVVAIGAGFGGHVHHFRSYYIDLD